MGKVDYEDPDRRVPGIALMNEGRHRSVPWLRIIWLIFCLGVIAWAAVGFPT